jgi:superfamily II DNA or RNA helicase
MADYAFQLKAAQKVCCDVENSAYIGALLNGAVGCGKTIVLLHALNIITAKYPNARILFLAHSQNSLKRQTLDTFADPNSPVKPKFTYGTLNDSDRHVTIAIPQEFYRLKIHSKYQYAVIDECHQWFSSKSVARNIIQRFEIKKLILATGTASKFVRFNQNTLGRKYSITVIAGEMATNLGLYSPLALDLVRVSDTREPHASLEAAFEKAKSAGDSADRPVVICANIDQASLAKHSLELRGYNVALATSKNDPNNLEIEKFKSGVRTALILVGRGLVGLNVPMADLMIDLKGSTNVENVLQYVARMFRRHPDGRKKAFIRVTTPMNWNRDVILLHKVMSLGREEIVRNYNGNNLEVKVS